MKIPVNDKPVNIAYKTYNILAVNGDILVILTWKKIANANSAIKNM